jgi:hypothetical protein
MFLTTALLQCTIDFRFAPLIAFKYTFGNFSVLRVGHEIFSVVAKCLTNGWG